MEFQRIRLTDLEQNKGQVEGLPSNPREWTRTDLDHLITSIKETPELLEARGLIVYPHEGKYIILGGNMRFSALREMNEVDAPCYVMPEDTPIEKLREIIIKDNGAFGSWDYDMLANEWDDLPLKEWGVDVAWDAVHLEEVAPQERAEVEDDDFDVENEHIETRCKRGDIWQLGDHRLMCGDSTSVEDIDMLLGGNNVRMVVTSPPYGVGKDYEEKGIDPWFKTIGGVINAIKGKALIICWNIGDLYSTGSQFTEPTGAYSISLLKDAGYGMLYNRIWKKPGANFAGNNPYYTVTTKPAQDYEYLFAFAELNAERHLNPLKDYLFSEARKAGINNKIINSIGGPSSMYGHWFTSHQWCLIDEANYKLIQSYCKDKGIEAFDREYEDIRDTYLRKTIFSHRLPAEEFSSWGLYGVWEFNTVSSRLGGHAAAFPLELPTRFIKIHSYPQDKVLEPFGGTGTTLIACEQLDRQCYAMELDPHYCDVIIARWEKHTGRQAEKIN